MRDKSVPYGGQLGYGFRSGIPRGGNPRVRYSGPPRGKPAYWMTFEPEPKPKPKDDEPKRN